MTSGVQADAPNPGHAKEPWVETRAGGLFFVSAVFVAPPLIALYPVLLRGLLHALIGFDRPSRILDPVPAVAAYVAPVVGWFALPALWLTLKARAAADRRWARRLLDLFVLVHVGTLAYTISRWL